MNKLILSTIALLSFGMSVILAQEKDSYDPWIWESEPPEDCPFEQSTEIVGVALTENYRHYKLDNGESYGDTWYPTWASNFEEIKPLIDWNNNCGCVTMTYNAALKKYLLTVTDGWPTVAKMNSYILESDNITGPWKL